MEWRRKTAPTPSSASPPSSRPSSSRSSLDGNWRSTQSDSPPSSPHPRTISPLEPEPGQVWYLKEVEDCQAAKQTIANGKTWASEGIHGHPVCVINTDKAEGTVDFVLMTSLGGHDLRYHTQAAGDRYYANHADEYLPINGAAVPDGQCTPQLSLPCGEHLPTSKNNRPTYLRFTEVWTCHDGDLELWYHELRSFSASSLTTILEYTSPYTSTYRKGRHAPWSGNRVQLPSPPSSPTKDASSTPPITPRKCRPEAAWKIPSTPRKGVAALSSWRSSGQGFNGGAFGFL